MDKEAAKKAIEELIERFRQADASGALKKYSEEDTKKNFILPLFRALGWDVDGPEVSAEETISGDRVDYGFYLDGRAQFYVEAKAAREDTEKQKFAEQAIGYSWNKGVTWAVLTNFRLLEIFNAEDATATISAKRFKSIHWDEYIDRFDELWLLSKDACREKLLDAEAEKVGKKLKRVSVTAKLVEDLNEARTQMSTSLLAWNPQLKDDPQLLDEGVQRILDRIIFIRVAEDRGVEAPTLRPLVREWYANWYGKQKRDKYLYQSMEQKFRELDGIYNSNIFAKHSSDDWIDEKNSLQDIVEKFYGKEGYYTYDFKVIPADILGTVYEQYLGHRLAKLEKGDLFGESDLGVAKDARKRKEQGIYYTPRFIVDYIVENALGPVLEKCTSIRDLQKIKVLDPACGSGSFLIKALELIYAKYKDFGAEGEEVKLQILTNNLYGVDLDEQAVEIARLNLLVASLEKRQKLPNLTNIRNGNSLISGTDEDLKKRFGRDWRDKKPFNWEKEFPQVFAQGGFDVVIGNPPYVNLANIKSEDEREYLKENFETAKNKSDLYSFFAEKAIKLLKINGRLGFIFSNSWMGTDSFSKFREYLLKNTAIEELVKLPPGVFEQAMVTAVLVFLEKNNVKDDHRIKLREYDKGNFIELNDLSYADIKATPGGNISFEERTAIKVPVTELGKIAEFSMGIKTSDNERFISDHKKDENSYPMLRGKDVNRYSLKYGEQWIWYMPKLMMEKTGAGPRRPEYFLTPKILFREITGGGIIACYDDEKYFPNNKLHVLYKSEKYDLFFVLAVVNSKFINDWVKSVFNNSFQVEINQLEKIPMADLDLSKPSDKKKHDKLAALGKKITALYKELQQEAEHSEKWNKLKTEIERTDKEIDQEVYKLYGLTSEEINLIELN